MAPVGFVILDFQLNLSYYLLLKLNNGIINNKQISLNEIAIIDYFCEAQMSIFMINKTR